MRYISKIELKKSLNLDHLARVVPKSAYAEHQALWRLFEGEQERDFLFRREQVGNWPVFYVLSSRIPQDPESSWLIHSKEFRPKLAAGQRFAFTLRANPVRTRKISDDPNVKKRRRDDVVMDAKRAYQDARECPSQAQLVQQAGPVWLEERAEKNGFTLKDLMVDDYRQHRIQKWGQSNPIRFSTLDYAGVLKIENVDKFLDALYSGIGPAKGFGCGLMLVRRA